EPLVHCPLKQGLDPMKTTLAGIEEQLIPGIVSVDRLAGVGPLFQQQFDDLRTPRNHSHVDGKAVPARSIDQLPVFRQEGLYLRAIAPGTGFVQRPGLRLHPLRPSDARGGLATGRWRGSFRAGHARSLARRAWRVMRLEEAVRFRIWDFGFR